MSARELTPMVLSLVLALLALAGTTDGAITCEAVTTRYESTVTCFFGTDIFETKHSFNLQFYYPNMQAQPETRLMCNWVTAENMDCKESQGVMYDRVLADQMTVKGPADPRRVGGKYVCQVLPPLDAAVKPCNLTFRDVTTTTTTTTTQPMALEDLTDKVNTTLILGGLVLTVALIIALIAVLFIFRVKLAEWIREWRKCKKKECDGEKPEGTADTGEKVNDPEQVALLTNAAKGKDVEMGSGKEEGDLHDIKAVKDVEVGSGKEEGDLLHMNPTSRLLSGEAGSPDDHRAKETEPVGDVVIMVKDVEVGSGKEEGDLLHINPTPRPSSGEEGLPVDSRTEETQPAGKEGDKKSKLQRFRDFFSPPAPKARPGHQNSTGTGDPPGVSTGDKDKSSGKGKQKKSGKPKKGKGEGEKGEGEKGEGEKGLPGNKQTQQQAPRQQSTAAGKNQEVTNATVEVSRK